MSVVDLKKTIDALPLSPVAYLLVILFCSHQEAALPSSAIHVPS